MEEDQILKGLKIHKKLLEFQICARKIKIYRDQRVIVDSIEELVCDRHPESGFYIADMIKGSHIFGAYKHRDGLKIYGCEECKNDRSLWAPTYGVLSNVREDSSILKTRAYDCLICDGIVLGHFRIEKDRSSDDSWAELAGRKGVHYYCKVCDSQLGEYYWAIS